MVYVGLGSGSDGHNLGSKMGSEGKTWWGRGLKFSLPVSMGSHPLHNLCGTKPRVRLDRGYRTHARSHKISRDPAHYPCSPILCLPKGKLFWVTQGNPNLASWKDIQFETVSVAIPSCRSRNAITQTGLSVLGQPWVSWVISESLSVKWACR